MDVAPLFLEELEVAKLLELFDLGGYGGLGNEEALGCPGAAEIFRRVVEDPQLVEVDHGKAFSWRIINKNYTSKKTINKNYRYHKKNEIDTLLYFINDSKIWVQDPLKEPPVSTPHVTLIEG
jgi:hypothetical protein